jgi:hypothetical protein
MLTCINLDPDVSIDEFQQCLDKFTAHQLESDLIHCTGPIGRRQRDTIMDTDDERDHDYFFIMSFRDRDQCDRAIACISRHEEPGDSIHGALFSKIKDQVFIAWEDI